MEREEMGADMQPTCWWARSWTHDHCMSLCCPLNHLFLFPVQWLSLIHTTCKALAKLWLQPVHTGGVFKKSSKSWQQTLFSNTEMYWEHSISNQNKGCLARMILKNFKMTTKTRKMWNKKDNYLNERNNYNDPKNSNNERGSKVTCEHWNN